MNVEDIIYKLYEFYKVSNNKELALPLQASPQTISNWKTRNSISAIKTKCRKLGIYKEIFNEVLSRNANDLVDRLMEFYGVDTISELAEYIEVSQPTISRWTKSNSIEAIKKKCQELGIYNDMFKDFIKEDSKEENIFIELISYKNMQIKRILLDWGIQGYGVTVGLILYLKKYDFLHIENIDLLADDLKASDFLINKIIEICPYFIIDNNFVKLNEIYLFKQI